jgi:hypothetical protein
VRCTRRDGLALGLLVLILLAGVVAEPVRDWLDPVEGMRARWRDDAALLDRLFQGTGPPLWSGAPAGHPLVLFRSSDPADRLELDRKMGGYPRRERTPAPDELLEALPDVPRDAWGHPYALQVAWAAEAWRLRSAGPDGRHGSPDDVVLFEWEITGYSMFHPIRWRPLLWLMAGLWVWAYGVARAWALPRMRIGAEVARAVVVVTPLFALSSMITGGLRLDGSGWNDLQVVPAWLAASLTISGGAALAILWRRTRALTEGR